MPIWSNFEMNLPGDPVREIESIEQLEQIRGGVLLLDEAHTVLNAREVAGKGRSRLIAFLSQLRKRRIWLGYTTQTPSRVDKQLRLQTDEVRYMTSVIGLRFFWCKTVSGFNSDDRVKGTGPVFFRQHIGDAFDTEGIVRAFAL